MPTPKLALRDVDSLTPDPQNARTHTTAQIEQLAGLIDRFGYSDPILADRLIRAGHGRQLAVQLIYSRGGLVYMVPGKERGGQVLPKGKVPVIDTTGWTDEECRAFNLGHNRVHEGGGWDQDLLLAQLNELAAADFSVDVLGWDNTALNALAQSGEAKARAGNLAAEFLVPPFSVISAREGWWRKRKADWLSLGIQSELGRGEVQSNLGSMRPLVGIAEPETWVTTSVFDPVLCELAYRWFCPVGGTVLDPFAGGSVRGIVAVTLGLSYTGVDLSAEQLAANDQQADTICGDGPRPTWLHGDSREVVPSLPDQADFILTCPPYGDLEVYSDDPADISNMEHDAFVQAYGEIIAAALAKLKDDRFACFVVGDYRTPAGQLRDLMGITVRAFEDAGAKYYNRAELVTPVGTLPGRAGRAFRASRKLGKTHQDVLVFVKGDWRRAVEALGDVDVEAALAQVQAAAGIDPDGGFELAGG